MRRLLNNLRPDLLITLGLFLLPLFIFWQVTLGGRTLIPADNLYQFQPFSTYRDSLGVPEVAHNMLLSDLVLENIVWKQFTRQSLAGGEIPLWNPYLFGGAPFLAAGQHSALYPFSLIYYLLPLPAAYGWFTVSQLWLAGLLMYLFLRGLRLGRLGALLGAITFQLSGFFLASVVFQMIIAGAAWLPFLLLMVEYTLRARPLGGKPAVVPWLIGGALGLGMTITAGHVEIVYYALLVMGLWAGLRLLGMLISRAEKVRVLVGRGLSLMALVALGMGVGAVQFVPFLELANSSFREGRSTFEQIRGYALPPRHGLAFLMPNIFGSPAQHEYVDLFSGQTRPIDWEINGVRVTDSMMPGGKNYVEGASYVGILPLILAGIGLLHGLRTRRPVIAPGTGERTLQSPPYRLILSLLGGISVLFAFGTPLYALLYYGLPGFSQLHSPFRWVFPLTLCLAALAAFGAEVIRRGAQGGAVHRWTGRIGLVCLAAGGLLLTALLLSRVFYTQVQGVIAWLYHALAGADLVYPNADVFYSLKFRDALILAVMLTLSGLLLILAQRRLRLFGAGAVILISADLILASAGFNPAADPAWLNFTPPSIQWLQARDPQSWRLSAIQGSSATLNANTAWLHGLQDVRGYDSIISRQYMEYMSRIQPQTQLLFNRIAPVFPDRLDALNSPWFDLLGVKYLMSEASFSLDPAQFPAYKEVYQDEAVRIYENNRAYPRAGSLEGKCEDQAQDTPAPVTPARLVETKNIQVMVEADLSVPGCLILFDSAAPGWRVYYRPQGTEEIEEQETTIRLMYGNFRGVDLPAGAWLVRFRYSPPSFQVGAFSSFLSLVILILIGMVGAWLRLYREGEGASSGVRRFVKNSAGPIVLHLFSRGIDLAFAFIMLRLLGPANAGTYYYAVVIFGWFEILTNFGLNTLLTREIAKDRSAAGRYLIHSGVLRIVLAVVGVPLLIGFFAVRGSLQPPLDATAITAIILLYIGLIPNSISTGLTAIFYAFERAEVPAFVTVLTVILKSGMGLIVLLMGFGVIGLAGVSIVLNLITLLILAGFMRALIRVQPAAPTAGRPPLEVSMMRGMLAAGFPLMLNHFLATIFFKSDVVLLEAIQGNAVVGIYSTAYKWIDALGVIPSLFTMALLPIMARQAVEDKAGLERNYHFAVKLLTSAAIPVAVLTTLSAHLLIGILGGSRFLPDGAYALQIMIWFAPIGWINSLTNYVLIALDQQRAMRWAFLAGVGFNVITNVIFIPIFSYRAAAAVTIGSELVLLVAFYLLLRRSLAPVNWLKLLWKPIAAGAIMGGVGAVLWGVSPALALIGSTAAYGVSFALLRPFSDWERGRFAALLPGRGA
ncbi:MAG: flippase [Anaerolineae bacterium]|nr:flippase [Anaerolineae bacterium]